MAVSKKAIPGVNGEFLPLFLQVAVEMKGILFPTQAPQNVSTNAIYFAIGGSVSSDQSTRHVLMLCGDFL